MPPSTRLGMRSGCLFRLSFVRGSSVARMQQRQFCLFSWHVAARDRGGRHSAQPALPSCTYRCLFHAVADPLKSFFATALLSWLPPAPQQLHV